MKKVLCLLYHRVKDTEDDVYRISVKPDVFERQMQFLKENYQIIRFEEDWESCDGENAVVITFDDGYWDNYEIAFPILERLQIPATFFISAGHIGTGEEFWWDKLVSLVSQEKSYPLKFTLEDELFHYTWNTGTMAERLELAKSLRYLLRMERDEKKFYDWIRQLQQWSGSYDADPQNRLMTWDDVRHMAQSRHITIGGHTMVHRSLGSLSDDRQKDEIQGSVQKLEAEIGQSVTVFSYPFGGNMDYNKVTIDLLKENGIQKSATTRIAAWSKGISEYEIPRLTVGNWDMDVLRERTRDCLC